MDGKFLLQQSVVTISERLLKQNRQHDSKNEQPSLLSGTVLVADLNCDEPHKRRQQQRHQPEERPKTNTMQRHQPEERPKTNTIILQTLQGFPIPLVVNALEGAAQPLTLLF